jgi:hypothetical protein
MQQWNEANITGTIQMCCHNFNGTNNRQKKSNNSNARSTMWPRVLQCGREHSGSFAFFMSMPVHAATSRLGLAQYYASDAIKLQMPSSVVITS